MLKRIVESNNLRVAVIGAPVPTVELALDDAISSWGLQENFRRATAQEVPDALYRDDPPLGGAHLFKLAIYAPVSAPHTSVLLTNVADGWNSLTDKLSKQLKVLQAQVLSSPQTDIYPRQSIEIWFNGESVRYIHVLRDSDRWVFFERGDRQSFEDSGAYNSRLIKDRLTRSMVVQYLRSLGCETASVDFLMPAHGVAVYDEIRKRGGPPVEEAQSELASCGLLQ